MTMLPLQCGRFSHVRLSENALPELPFQNLHGSPGPFAFWHTPEEKKEYQYFDYSEEGYEKAIQYLNEAFEAKNWRDEQLPF